MPTPEMARDEGGGDVGLQQSGNEEAEEDIGGRFKKNIPRCQYDVMDKGHGVLGLHNKHMNICSCVRYDKGRAMSTYGRQGNTLKESVESIGDSRRHARQRIKATPATGVLRRGTCPVAASKGYRTAIAATAL